MTLLQLKPAAATDPVVAYDVMREAATRLVSAYYSTAGGTPASDETMRLMRAVSAEARAVPFDDIDAQLAATESFNDRRGRVLRGE